MECREFYDQVVCIPATVRKAEVPQSLATAGILPRRLEVEASCEEEDAEGDIIKQKALLDSAEGFLKKGDIDLEHISKHGSEILALLPVEMRFRSPEDYIIGRPVDVKDVGGGRTVVKADIFGGDGSKHPAADWFWQSLERGDTWQASIYGTVTKADMGGGAKRMVVTGMDWTSLAMTRRPVNKSLVYSAKIVKSALEGVLKGILGGEIPIVKGDGCVFAEKGSLEGYRRTNSIVPSDYLESLDLPTVYEMFEKWVEWRLLTGRFRDDAEKSAREFLTGPAARYMYPALQSFLGGKSALIDLYVYGMLGYREHGGRAARDRVNSGSIYGEVPAVDKKPVFDRAPRF